NKVRSGLLRPVDIAVLEFLECALLELLLATAWCASSGVRPTHVLVLGTNSTVDDVAILLAVLLCLYQNTVLEELVLSATVNIDHRCDRVLHISCFIPVFAPGCHHGFSNRMRASRWRPIDRAILKVHEASHAIGSGFFTCSWEAQPRGWSAHFCITRIDAHEERMRAAIRRPVSGSSREVLSLAIINYVFIIQAVADDDVAGHLCDVAGDLAVCAAVYFTQAEGISDVWPSLSHFKLPVRPAVNT